MRTHRKSPHGLMRVLRKSLRVMRVPRKSLHIHVQTFQLKRRFGGALLAFVGVKTAVRSVRTAFAGKGGVDDGRQSAYA